MALTKKQIGQVIISVAALCIIIAEFTFVSWGTGKILTVISMVLVILSMALSFREEEKRKNSQS